MTALKRTTLRMIHNPRSYSRLVRTKASRDRTALTIKADRKTMGRREAAKKHGYLGKRD